MEDQSWQSVAERFQKNRASRLPQKWLIPQTTLDEALGSTARAIDIFPQWLSNEELEITALGASALAAKIISGEYTSLQVTEAFCHRAAIAQQLTNCLSEIFFDEALEEAGKLDDKLKAGGKPVGPLHGVPISVKDHYNVKGQYTTAGYISYGQNPVKDEDAHIVEILRKSGAVLYAKTTNPQCMMVLETVSNIYGRTLNPWNTKLGAGGSSGGEGSLLALHGSPLGVGSDIGGSIRVPASFNGLYGFKPSGKRVPTAGWECTMIGQESITAVAGPLGHNVEDLELFFRIVSDAQPWLKEPLLAMPWRTEGLHVEQQLTIGVMKWDEVVMPHPYITRVIDEVTEKLKAAGHEVVPFKPYRHKESWDDILLPLYFTDGGADIRNTLAVGNEPMLASAKRLMSDPIVKARSVHEIWKLHIARDVYKTEYLRHWSNTSQATSSGKSIDVLICPVAPVASTPHDVKPWWGYCSQWNLLDYPSGIIPAGKVLADDKYPENYQAVNELDRENLELYDNSLYCGMPVTIQVVGRTHEDEKVMNAMKIIDKVVYS